MTFRRSAGSPSWHLLARDSLRYLPLRIWAWLRYRNRSTDVFEEFRQADRVLFVRMQGIGDVVWMLPALRAVRRLLPAARIDALVRPCSRSLLEPLGLVDHIFEMEPRNAPAATRSDQTSSYASLMQRLRSNHYDFVFDLHGQRETRRISFYVSGRRMVSALVGTNGCYRYHKSVLTELASDLVPLEDEDHPVDRSMRLIEKVHGGPLGVDYVLDVPAAKIASAQLSFQRLGLSKKYAIVHPVSTEASRNWPLARFAAVADHLIENYNLDILLTGSSRDTELLQELSASVANARRCRIAAETFDILELAAVCKQAAIVVAVDTCIVHLADAVGCPVLGIFTPWNLMHYPYKQKEWALAPECEGEQFDLDVIPADEHLVHRISSLATSTVISAIDERLAAALVGA